MKKNKNPPKSSNSPFFTRAIPATFRSSPGSTRWSPWPRPRPLVLGPCCWSRRRRSDAPGHGWCRDLGCWSWAPGKCCSSLVNSGDLSKRWWPEGIGPGPQKRRWWWSLKKIIGWWHLWAFWMVLGLLIRCLWLFIFGIHRDLVV